jgi:hypothetical protein
MDNKSPQLNDLRKKDIMENHKSFQPVVREGWAIKFSTLRESNILIIFTSLYTGQTIVRYFIAEEDAVMFINYMAFKDPKEEHDL